jgi:hypothetical protein
MKYQSSLELFQKSLVHSTKKAAVNAHASGQDKSRDVKCSFCEELGRVFDHFRRYGMKILLGD